MGKSKSENQTTTQVFWRLPEALVSDCERVDKYGRWAEGLRTLLRRAMARDRQLVVEGPPRGKAMSLPDDLGDWLDAEALRLTTETGQNWSRMKVAREIWRQERLSALTKANNSTKEKSNTP